MDKNKIQESDKLILFPNPVNKGVNSIHVYFTNGGIIKRLEIYDVFGMRVIASDIKQDLNISELEKGIYVVKAYVYNENVKRIKAYYKKLVIK